MTDLTPDPERRRGASTSTARCTATTRSPDPLGIQLGRALDAGELTVEQVREAAIQLIPYVGHPSSSDLHRVGEGAIAAHVGGAAWSRPSAGHRDIDHVTGRIDGSVSGRS